MRFSAKKLTLMAVLTAVALIVFIIEAQIPAPVPVPGAKLGLANVVTLFALFWRESKGRDTFTRREAGNEAPACGEDGLKASARGEDGFKAPACGEDRLKVPACGEENGAATVLTAVDALMILICRIVLGAAFSGNAAALAYSIAGGMFAFTAEVALRRFVTDKQIWVCGVAGAVSHNVGQILAAMLITGTPYIAALLPVLIVIAIITGIVTGLVAQFAVARLSG